MPPGEIVAGQRQRWSLLHKLGEGDAGEVYRAESLLERKPAIVKRPHRSAFSSDVMRQAAQIRTESRILKALEAMLPGSDLGVSAPALLDQGQAGAELGDRTFGDSYLGEQYFIVIDEAPGYDLNSLARLAHFGQMEEPGFAGASQEERLFLQRLVEQANLPELILLRALDDLIELFEKIHFAELALDGQRQHGLIWNDVKPEHIFWDPVRARLTVIDWGNGQYLEADGGTRDRRYSRLDDYFQFIQEMGRFLAEACPELYDRLAWPSEVSPANAYSHGIKPLKERITAVLAEAEEGLREARRQEGDLVAVPDLELSHLQTLGGIQARLLDLGEIPDHRSAIKVHARLAGKLAAAGRLADFRQVCALANAIPGANPERWRLLDDIVALAEAGGAEKQASFCRALETGAAEDWPAALWELSNTFGAGPAPSWWDDISQRIRQHYLQTDPDALLPSVAVSRLFYTLQANAFRTAGDWSQDLPAASNGGSQAPNRLQSFQSLLQMLDEEVVRKWKEVEPAPPNSGIEYRDIDGLLDEIEAILPGTRGNLDKVLSQPRAQAKIVMEAWGRKEFDTARRGLRLMLVWDPIRRRLWLADRAVLSAPRWLARVRQGARGDEPFQDFLTEVELDGRELRNRVGPARWLDLILATLKGLRNGARPADLMIDHPEVLNEMPWLSEYRSRETVSLPHSRPLTLEREEKVALPVQWLRGVQEGTLGADIRLGIPLDGWVAEARGSSARVFLGRLTGPGSRADQFAVKIMRPGSADYSLPLFREEAQILSLMRDIPGVTRLVECGFMKLDEGQEIPADDRRSSAEGLRGQVQRFGVEDVQNFLVSLDRYTGQGWLPYLALELRDHAYNLMVYCDAGHTHGQFLPLRQSLLLAIQICDILQVAHDRSVVYRDHKILHYYWDPAAQGVVMIDWNIARRYPQGLTAAERQFDLVQFGARALHHILTGRPAPGALPMGPNRPEEIEQASHSYNVQWTYDDERLPNRIKEILAAVLEEGYGSVRELRQDLFQVYQQLPEPDAELEK